MWVKLKYPKHNYSVSNTGKVRNDIRGNILKDRYTRQGYVIVQLPCVDKGLKNYTVHRLVGKAFIPNPNKFPCINHKDEDKSNNRVDNLEWCNHSYNNSYGSLSKKVAQIDLEGNIVRIWKNPVEARDIGGFYNSHIYACCNGTRKTHRGYKWEYLEPREE